MAAAPRPEDRTDASMLAITTGFLVLFLVFHKPWMLLVAVGAGLKGDANATLHEVEAGGSRVQILAFTKGKQIAKPTADGTVITIGGQKITVAKDGLTFAVTTKPAVPTVGKPPVLRPNKDLPKPATEGEQGE